MVEGSVNEMSLLCKPLPTMADRQSGTLPGVCEGVWGVFMMASTSLYTPELKYKCSEVSYILPLPLSAFFSVFLVLSITALVTGHL